MPNFGLFATGFFSNFGYDIFKNMFARGLRPDAQVGITMKWNISNFYTFNKTKKQIQIGSVISAIFGCILLHKTLPNKDISH